jgi:hypothetical protein
MSPSTRNRLYFGNGMVWSPSYNQLLKEAIHSTSNDIISPPFVTCLRKTGIYLVSGARYEDLVN